MGNMIVSWQPEKERRIIICSHYDTRPIADQEPERRKWREPFISANDGGLVLKELWDGKEFEMAAMGPLAFSAKNDLSFTLRFTADNAGGITQVLVFEKDIWDKVK